MLSQTIFSRLPSTLSFMSKEITTQSLRKVNIFAGILHLVQMAAVLALSNDFALHLSVLQEPKQNLRLA